MFSSTVKKALVVASVALTLPVLSAGTALADSDSGHGKGTKDQRPSSGSTGHGKGDETDKSGSSSNPDGSFQGKSSSTPDQDGKGTDRGADGNDKTGPGTDGNNGCGNEPRLAAPRDGGRPTDDDNNGWCGSKPKPAHRSAQAPAPTTAPERSTAGVTLAAPVASSPAATGSTGTISSRVLGGSALTGSTAGSAVSAQAVRVVPVTTGGGGGIARSAAAPSTLPFTGAPVGLLLVLGGLALVAGVALTRTGRTQRA